MAEADSAAIMRWVESHAGAAEEVTAKAVSGGLHGGRLRPSAGPGAARPSRYVLPAGVCGSK
jgi:hypothetical protein